MRCNACWRELEGRAVSTTCGHILCNEDASKILSSDGACPICDQVLSKRGAEVLKDINNVIMHTNLMKPVDTNPNDEWVNTVMAGISPQTLMKTAYKSVMFYTGQNELEMQYKMNRVVAQCRQKCQMIHEKFSEKMEQIHAAYQKMGKRCQMMEQEIESLRKDKQELQEKFAEKSKQKRKLDEMYDQLSSEYEAMKRSAIQPANNFFHRAEPNMFPNPANVMDNRDSMRKDRSILTPETPGQTEDMWAPPGRQNPSDSGHFDISGDSPRKSSAGLHDAGIRRTGARPAFGAGNEVAGGGNPSMGLRNLILSPIKRPQFSRSRPQLFTL